MPLSLYQALIPTLLRGLDNLSAVLAKGKAYAEANQIDMSTLLEAQLAPDMYSLTRQIQAVSDAAKFGAARLGSVTPPPFPDTETTYDELQARIARTVDFVKSVSEAQINASEGGTVTMKVRGKDLTFPSQIYLQNFVLPNFYFHATAAYAILRHKGVPLGKMDFLGSM